MSFFLQIITPSTSSQPAILSDIGHPSAPSDKNLVRISIHAKDPNSNPPTATSYEVQPVDTGTNKDEKLAQSDNSLKSIDEKSAQQDDILNSIGELNRIEFWLYVFYKVIKISSKLVKIFFWDVKLCCKFQKYINIHRVVSQIFRHEVIWYQNYWLNTVEIWAWKSISKCSRNYWKIKYLGKFLHSKLIFKY